MSLHEIADSVAVGRARDELSSDESDYRPNNFEMYLPSGKRIFTLHVLYQVILFLVILFLVTHQGVRRSRADSGGGGYGGCNPPK